MSTRKWKIAPSAYACTNSGCTYVARYELHLIRHRGHCPADHEEMRSMLSVRIDNAGCWIPGTTSTRAKIRGGQRAHRVSLTLKLQRGLTHGMEACHTCDVPNCVNPEHLWEGTHRENMRDMIMKGRGRGQFGRAQ